MENALYKIYLMPSVFLVFHLCGCATSEFDIRPSLDGVNHAEHSELHALYVDRRGYAVNEDIWSSPPFDTRSWYGSERDEVAENVLIAAIIERAKSELERCDTSSPSPGSATSRSDGGRKEILIFIHGGLNTNKVSLGRTKELLGKIPSNCRFPIFVNWRSGPFSSYKDHLIRLRQGAEGGFLAKLSSPIYFATDLGQSVVGAPKSWLTQGEHAIRSSSKDAYPDYDAIPSCGGNGQSIACKPSRSFACGTDEPKRGLSRAIWWGTSPSKLFVTPLTFNLGKPSWDVMLHRTNTLFWKTCDLNDGCEGRPSDAISDGMGYGAFAKLIRALKALTESTDDYEITLVGHSMGAIVINRLVTTLPDLPIRNIVFLASADSIRNTHSGALAFMRKHEEARFYSWMLHPRNEARELSGKGFFPSGSLLMWIDNMFTTPETLLDYRFGRWDSVKLFPELFEQDLRSRTRLLVFPLDDAGAPHKHGDFSECRFWELDEIENFY